MNFALFFLGEYAHDYRFSGDSDPFLWCVARSVPADHARNPYSIWAVLLGLIYITAFFVKVAYLSSFLSGSADAVALPVGSIDEARLVFFHRDRFGERVYRRNHSAFHAKIRS